jgi:hypothetical protein
LHIPPKRYIPGIRRPGWAGPITGHAGFSGVSASCCLPPPSWARSFCPAFAWHASQGVPSETCGSTCPNPCLIVAFSNPLRRHETSAVRQDAGRLWADQFSTTKLGGPIDQAGRVPQRDALRTVGHDRVEAGTYLFGGICKKPQEVFLLSLVFSGPSQGVTRFPLF